MHLSTARRTADTEHELPGGPPGVCISYEIIRDSVNSHTCHRFLPRTSSPRDLAAGLATHRLHPSAGRGWAECVGGRLPATMSSFLLKGLMWRALPVLAAEAGSVKDCS